MTGLGENDRLVSASGRVVSAYVSHNPLAASDLTTLIGNVHRTLRRLTSSVEPATIAVPAVPVRRSVRHDRIVCLECGLAFKSLKRHLRVQHNLTAELYRGKWALASDYPIVAPDYAARRSELAKSFGLGRKGVAKPSSAQTDALARQTSTRRLVS